MFRLTWTTEKELGRQISLEEKHENSIAVVRKWEMLAARWKWAAAKKWKRSWTQETKSLVNTYDNSSIKIITRTFYVLAVQNGIVVVKNNGKERQKPVLHVQICYFFFLLINLLILMPFLLPSSFSIIRFIFCFFLFISIINQSFAFSLGSYILYFPL